MATVINRPPLSSWIQKARRLGLFVGGLEFNRNQTVPIFGNRCAFQRDAFQQTAFQVCIPTYPDSRYWQLNDKVPYAKRRAQLEHWQNLPGWRSTQASFGDGAGAAQGDAIASATGESLADATASASGDATASAAGDSTVFPFAHQQVFDVARRARRIVTLEQWQNPTLIVRYNQDTTGTATGDAIASGEGNSLFDATASATGDANASAAGDSTVFPFAHQSQFDIVQRARRIVTLEQWQTLPNLRNQVSTNADGSAIGDANASAVGESLADASGSASGDAIASASDGSTFFPFAHHNIIETVSRARRIVTLEQWQNPTLLGLRRNSDADGAASGDATASAEGSSTVFPFSRKYAFDIVQRAKRIVTLEQWQTLATKTVVAFSQADGTATGDSSASAEGSSLADAVGSAIGDAVASGALEGIFDAVGSAQGDSDASAVGRRSKRVKLVQGVEGGHQFDLTFTHALERRIDRLHFDAAAFQNNAFETLFVQGQLGHVIVDGVPLPARGTASFSQKAGSSSFPIRRGRAEF